MTPDLYLITGFVLDERGRIVSTREPNPVPGPLFTLIRSASSRVWALRADVSNELATDIDRLAADEQPLRDFEGIPKHVDEYLALLKGRITSGPAFSFPDKMESSGEVVQQVLQVDSLRLLARHFLGWTSDEIPERSPIMAISDGGYPVSICFCARNSKTAAEAGVETAVGFRGRGFAPRVTAAWASAIRASGRVPLYSTSWSNAASRAVARKLKLVQYASYWSVDESD